jgi:hypothetical protein
MYATGVDWYYCTIAYVLVDATPFKKALSIHSCKTPPHIAFTLAPHNPKAQICLCRHGVDGV